MPSSPEFTDTGRNIRIIKILMEMKSKHHSESQRHITVAAEIKIDLQHIGNCAQPSTRTGDSGCCRTKEIIRHKSHCIGDKNLFAQTCNETPDSFSDFLRRLLTIIDLRLHIMILNDRSRDQLWEKRDIQKHLSEILLNRSISPINIDHVGKCLKSKKRYSDRHPDLRNRNSGTGNRIKCLHQKSGIFKDHKKTEIYHHSQCHCELTDLRTFPCQAR